jgi:hypothetical protein
MLTKSFLRLVLAGALALGLVSASLHAQVVSTGVTGLVRDTGGNPIVGATVTAVHLPTNATSLAVTNQVGRFTITGLPAGGPFTVTATADGFTTNAATDVQTDLGNNAEVSITMKSGAIVMEKFVATASRNDLDAGSMGAGSTLSAQRIESQPSVSRSFADLMKTNAFVAIRAGGDRVTALGMNNKFNSVTVDGARTNDAFGLNGSGLQSFSNPFALDALEQFSVELSPYDVRRSGFTGASINAVTKSGTNDFHGSAYYIFTNSGLQQRDIVGANAGGRTFSEEKTRGYTLGGPILKNRLFFFVNYEKYERDAVPVSPVFQPDAAVFSTIQARLNQLATGAGSGVDFGGISGGANHTEDEKKLIKLDWNINRSHRLTARFSQTVGTQPSFGGLNSTSFSSGAALTGAPAIGRITALTSNFYTQNRTEKMYAGQIFSNWTPNLKTVLAYSDVSYGQQSPVPVTYPEVRIYNVPGKDANTGAAITNGVVVFGTENSRHGNVIDVPGKTYSATGDYTWKQYTFSGGYDHEESSFLNLFRQTSYGVFGYNGAAAFTADTPFAFTRSYVQTGFPAGDYSEFTQDGFFGQVKMDVSSRLTLTAGVRYDKIGSAVAPSENAAFKAGFGITNAGTVDGTDSFAPRFGLNYALDDERTTQIRGGTGVILGRNPWVWISNSYGATGVGRYSQSLTATGATPAPTLNSYIASTFDKNKPIGATPNALPAAAAVIALIPPGTELPSVWRSNLAFDRKLSAINATFSVEYIYSHVLNSFFVDNLNIRPTTVGADGRQRYAGAASAAPLVAGFANVIRTRNVKSGSSGYLALSLDRPLRNGWGYGLSYTRGRAAEAQALGSTTAASQWQFNPTFNQNTIEVGRSDFEIRNRIQGSFTKEFKYWRKHATVVSLFYEGRTGSPYSWVYTSDLNNDGFTGNDLVAVPTDGGDKRFDFSALNAAQLDTYLKFFKDNGLSKFAGGYAPRNEFFQPWQNRLDLRVVQKLPVWRNVQVELFADFINFGSWLSKDLFNYVETLPVPTNTGLTRLLGTNASGSPASASYAADGRVRIIPQGTFNTDGSINLPSGGVITVNNGDSRWRLQFGARLKF